MEDFSIVYSNDTGDKIQLIAFAQESIDTTVPSEKIRVGVLITVPHNEEMVTFNVAMQRIRNNSLVVFTDKNSVLKSKARKQDNSWLREPLKAVSMQIDMVFKPWLIKRLQQLKDSTASLEECLDVISKTNGLARSVIDIDSILNAHRIAAPADVWTMFRRQANTPYNRFDLINILSEYATNCVVGTQKIKLMAEAGSMIATYGDLELRPVWVHWDKQDLSDRLRLRI
jgi:hypothetical protein